MEKAERQKLPGHASVIITMSRYVHVTYGFLPRLHSSLKDCSHKWCKHHHPNQKNHCR